MKITIEIKDEDIESIVQEAARKFIERHIGDVFEDGAREHWEEIDKQVEQFLTTKEFSSLVKKVLKDSELEFISAIKRMVTGNLEDH